MISAPLWLAGNWRAIAMLGVVAALGGGLLWYRGEAAQAELDLAEFRHAYDTLSRSVGTQNEAVLAMERKAEETLRKAAKLRAEAQPKVDAAQKSADSLAGAMRGLRPAECPTAGAVAVVRKDLTK